MEGNDSILKDAPKRERELTPEEEAKILDTSKDEQLTFDEAYSVCRERERIRTRGWRDTEQGAFESAMMSTETMLDGFSDPSKAYAFSDCGLGAQAIVDYIDGVGTVSHFMRCINKARMKLMRVNPKLLKVFYLVLKNGTNRKESIWELSLKRRKSTTRHGCSTHATSPESSKSLNDPKQHQKLHA